MTEPKKVYVAERGCYEDRGVAGIFDTPERAMAAMPGTKWTKTRWADYPDHSKHSRVEWSNELDWDDAVRISEEELVSEGPERPPDESVVQTYRDSDGGWDYIPDTAFLARAESEQ